MKTQFMRLSCCLLIWTSIIAAQEFRATISGEVTDPGGAAVEGARVIATSLERNVPYEATTNSAGRYVVQFLLPGKYVLTVEKAGFKKFVREEVNVLSADKLAIDIRLELGAVVDSVTVTGEVSLLQTETATRQATFENRILENVPSGGRNLYALQYDQPGVVKTSTYWGSMELYAFGNVNSVMISGGRSGENETVLDGLTNTKSDRGVAFVPSINSTQEFTVQTNSYDAQFGRVGGGVTMINLKSGTNSIHGQLFEYLKNEKLRANDWVANKAGDPKTAFKNNTFGFELDGPFYIPKVFDGRNKAFFMISLEGLREHTQGGQGRTLPLPDQMRGDFSQLYNDDGNLVSLYDPLTTRLGPDNTTYIRTPFAGNVIPASRLNPVAAKVASFYPAPNLPGDGPGHQNNYQKILPQTNTYDSWLGKMDYMFSEKSHVSFRYGQTPWLNYAKLVWGNNPAEPSNEYPSTRIARNWGADWTYTLSPSVVFNLRGGLARYEGFSGNEFGVNYDPRQLGFPSSLVGQFTTLEFPRFNLGDYSEIGSQGVFSYATQDVWSLQPNMSLTRGRHFLKFGAEFRRYNDNNLNPGLASGLYSFDKSWTQGNPQRGDSVSGNEFASFLLGYPTTGYVDHNIDPAYRSKYYSLFVQDDFKVSSRLTLNLGLRWDYESPRFERYDRMLRGFAFDQASPIAPAVQSSPAASNCPACAAGLKGGLLYAGADGDNRYAFIPHKRNFQPRIGVAYRMTSKLVFRGGYGLSYLGQNANGQAVGFSRQTPLVSSIDNGLTPAVSLSDPFPASIYPGGLLQPIGNSQGLSTNLGQNVTFQYLDRPLPYSQQYSAGFQYELPGGWLVDASYVGNITKRLPVALPLNFIPANVLTSLPVEQRQAYFNQQVANPMAGLLPNSGLNGATLARQQLLFAFPQYGSGTQITDVPIGWQRYDAAQLKATRRFSHGLTMTVAYTISKTLEQASVLNAQDVNLNDLRSTPLEKRLIQYDVPQQFSVIGTYDLPFGKGRRFGSGMNRWVNGIVGGWTFSGVFMSHSGFPLPFPNAAPLEARSARLSDSQRDALAQKAGRSQYDPSYDVWFDTSLFPRTAQAPFTLRNFPTRFPDVRSKPLNVTDLSLYKEFQIREKVKWQIRCDAHNAGNFPWFGQLDSNGADVTRPLFGHLRADIGNETRVVVGVMKVIF
ncbi:MAG TPA: TonB-dependent receptor [Bryobacteraceae bacterium]|nr:TonB-dependent receptor [Bryobacteraceae bacterium]